MAAGLLFPVASPAQAPPASPPPTPLPRISVAKDGRSFEDASGKPFVPFGVNYFRPGTGWAPQLWKRFDPDATRRDFALLKAHGGNCVRVFLSYGSFYPTPGALSPDGLSVFDRFLKLAEEAGLYVHPTGPDHWEGLPEWARGDRITNEAVLKALESFWTLFAGRYKGRGTIFAYDLLNEPVVSWGGPTRETGWNRWLQERYGGAEKAAAAWGVPAETLAWGRVPVPPPEDKPRDRRLLDYQAFRESLADAWTRRQAAAIRAADPQALVTVGILQWSVPVAIGSPEHYVAFRPARQAALLDFLEFHFYPLYGGVYEYRDPETRDRNLAYLECVAREMARCGKPVVVAEYGWYGGGAFENHPAATEDDQAEWCAGVVETTAGLAVGWLNWGMYDTPEAKDVSVLTGLFTADGREKAWGRRFRELAARFAGTTVPAAGAAARPPFDWDLFVTSPKEAGKHLEEYVGTFRQAREKSGK